jgi:Fe2+ transport system protein FeoA
LQSKFSLNNKLKPKRTVADLKQGESAFVSLLDENAYTCKLLNLGLLPRARVTMVRESPFGGACYIRLEGCQLAMRWEEAKTIYIEEV